MFVGRLDRLDGASVVCERQRNATAVATGSNAGTHT